MVRRLLAQRHFAVLLCAAVLLLKLVVPTGYMIDRVDGHLAITLCPGAAPVPIAASGHDAMAMPDHGPDHGRAHDGMGHAMVHDAARTGSHDHHGTAHGATEMPCAFAGLSAAVMDAVDPVLLAVFIAFVMTQGLVRVGPVPPAAPARLRPPLRGPPLPA